MDSDCKQFITPRHFTILEDSFAKVGENVTILFIRKLREVKKNKP